MERTKTLPPQRLAWQVSCWGRILSQTAGPQSPGDSSTLQCFVLCFLVVYCVGFVLPFTCMTNSLLRGIPLSATRLYTGSFSFRALQWWLQLRSTWSNTRQWLLLDLNELIWFDHLTKTRKLCKESAIFVSGIWWCWWQINDENYASDVAQRHWENIQLRWMTYLLNLNKTADWVDALPPVSSLLPVLHLNLLHNTRWIWLSHC